MNKFMQFIFIILFICILFYIIFINYNFENEKKCIMKNTDIDDIYVIKRTPEYLKMINNMIDEKKFLLDNNELNIIKKPQQIFKLSDNNKNIVNISKNIYEDCKTDININDFNDITSDNNIDTSDDEYNKIYNLLKDDIQNITTPNESNIAILKNNLPFSKNYLKNYYKDFYGNIITSNLSDYFSAYYTLIDADDKYGFPVKTKIGKSNFIIPDQYKNESNFTNAYNIDWSRIINPIGYSML